MKAAGGNPYPHKFHVSLQLPEFIAKYQDCEVGKQLTDDKQSIAGE